jgi:hypothetical protein
MRLRLFAAIVISRCASVALAVDSCCTAITIGNTISAQCAATGSPANGQCYDGFTIGCGTQVTGNPASFVSTTAGTAEACVDYCSGIGGSAASFTSVENSCKCYNTAITTTFVGTSTAYVFTKSQIATCQLN